MFSLPKDACVSCYALELLQFDPYSQLKVDYWHNSTQNGERDQFGAMRMEATNRLHSFARFDVGLALDDCEVLRELIRARSASE